MCRKGLLSASQGKHGFGSLLTHQLWHLSNSFFTAFLSLSKVAASESCGLVSDQGQRRALPSVASLQRVLSARPLAHPIGGAGLGGGRAPSASAETAWTRDCTRVRPDVRWRIVSTGQSGETWQPTGVAY